MTTIRDLLETAVLAIPLVLIVFGYCISIYGIYLILTTDTMLDLVKGAVLFLSGAPGGYIMALIANRAISS